MKIINILENISQIDEAKKKKDTSRPCWPGYKQVGWKKGVKGKKDVPHCVPDKT